jgi:AAA15 family ATPase/GTPase
LLRKFFERTFKFVAKSSVSFFFVFLTKIFFSILINRRRKANNVSVDEAETIQQKETVDNGRKRKGKTSVIKEHGYCVEMYSNENILFFCAFFVTSRTKIAMP